MPKASSEEGCEQRPINIYHGQLAQVPLSKIVHIHTALVKHTLSKGDWECFGSPSIKSRKHGSGADG
jgi:hypothetical protein